MADAAAPPPPITIPLKEDAVSAAPPERIELNVTIPSTQPCDAPPTGEIVVCAPDSVVYRLGAVSKQSVEALPKAEFKVSGTTTLGAQLLSGSVGNTPTNRVMVTAKVAF